MRYETIDPVAEREMLAARSSMILEDKAIWWGTIAISRLTPVQDLSCETAWTDGRYLGYNPRFTTSLSHQKRIGLWAHEVEHITRKHHLREMGRDHAIFNEAADEVINPGLTMAGFVLPDGGLMGEPGDELRTAEEVYARKLQKQQKEGQGKAQGDGQEGQEGQDGKEDQKAQGGQNGKSQKDDQKDQDQDDQKEDQKSDQADDGKAQEDDSQKGGYGSAPGQWGEVRKPTRDDGSTMDPTELAQEERDLNIAMTQAAMIAARRGHLPGHAKGLLADIGDIKADWREEMREFATEIGRNDTSWFPPNKRYIHAGMYLPSLRSYEIGEGWLIIDTSGSTCSILKEFAEHVKAMCEQHQVAMNILYVDTRVNGDMQRVEVGEELELEVRGGGGTDFRPGFDWLEEEGITPKWLVYFTDMCGTMPEKDLGFPVLWAKWGKWDTEEPPFGRVIEVSD